MPVFVYEGPNQRPRGEAACLHSCMRGPIRGQEGEAAFLY